MKKKHLRVIKEITDSIPTDLLSNLTTMEIESPTLLELVKRGKDDPQVPEEKRERYKAIFESGYFDKKVEVINESVEKQISDYVDFAIEKAIKDGRLPPRTAWPKLKLKSKKNVRERNKKEREEGKSVVANNG